MPRRQPRIDYAMRRKDQTIERSVIQAVMRAASPFAEHIGRVIQSPQKPLLVEVGGLFAAVCGKSGRVSHAECLPAGTILLPPQLALRAFKTRPEKIERRHRVVPQRVTEEIEQVQVVPNQPPLDPTVNVAGDLALFDDGAFFGLQP